MQNNEAWIGLTDVLAEGEWRKPGSSASDDAFDADVDENLFSWASGEPDGNTAKNCVYVGLGSEMDVSNCCADASDDTCKSEDSYAGDKYGLCEIPVPEGEND